MSFFITTTWISLISQFNYSYTKALEVIKKLHKDQAQEIKTFRLKLENLQTIKDQAYKVYFLQYRLTTLFFFAY